MNTRHSTYHGKGNSPSSQNSPRPIVAAACIEVISKDSDLYLVRVATDSGRHFKVIQGSEHRIHAQYCRKAALARPSGPQLTVLMDGRHGPLMDLEPGVRYMALVAEKDQGRPHWYCFVTEAEYKEKEAEFSGLDTKEKEGKRPAAQQAPAVQRSLVYEEDPTSKYDGPPAELTTKRIGQLHSFSQNRSHGKPKVPRLGSLPAKVDAAA